MKKQTKPRRQVVLRDNEAVVSIPDVRKDEHKMFDVVLNDWEMIPGHCYKDRQNNSTIVFVDMEKRVRCAHSLDDFGSGRHFNYDLHGYGLRWGRGPFVCIGTVADVMEQFRLDEPNRVKRYEENQRSMLMPLRRPATPPNDGWPNKKDGDQ